MSYFEHCKKAKEDKQTLQEMIMEYESNNRTVPNELILHYLYNRAVCHDYELMPDWKKYNEEVEGAVYPDVEHKITAAEAKAWVAKMYHKTLTGAVEKGEHWSMEQTESVAKTNGVKVDPATWYAALNMIWHDYYGATKTTEDYIDMAKKFLHDDDGKPGDEKLYKYYKYVA